MNFMYYEFVLEFSIMDISYVTQSGAMYFGTHDSSLNIICWTKKAWQEILQPLQFMSWRKKEKMRITWISWALLATPKWLGGLAILNLGMHLMARLFSFL